jgi:hypothetical protein
MERVPLDVEELVEHWTLLDGKRELVAGKRGSTMLGFVLLLKYYPKFGRFPCGRADIARRGGGVRRRPGGAVLAENTVEWAPRTGAGRGRERPTATAVAGIRRTAPFRPLTVMCERWAADFERNQSRVARELGCRHVDRCIPAQRSPRSLAGCGTTPFLPERDRDLAAQLEALAVHRPQAVCWRSRVRPAATHGELRVRFADERGSGRGRRVSFPGEADDPASATSHRCMWARRTPGLVSAAAVCRPLAPSRFGSTGDAGRGVLRSPGPPASGPWLLWCRRGRPAGWCGRFGRCP